MESDPLKIGAELELAQEFYPLGFPLRLETNSREVMTAAEESWAAFPAAFEAEPIEMRVLVEPGDEPARPPVFRAARHLITITSGAENFAVCDHTRGFTFCRLNETVAANGDFVRYSFLEAMAFFTLTQLHVTPVHAAAVARGGRAVLLAGASGAGKSTLACACARRGWTYISDNETWLLRRDARTVLGNPGRIRLRDTAVELFPDLAGLPAFTFNGKRSVLLDTCGMSVAWSCRPSCVVFLERTGELAALEPCSREAAFDELMAGVICYSPEVRAAHRRSLEDFVEVPAFRLRYHGIEDAVEALEELVAC